MPLLLHCWQAPPEEEPGSCRPAASSARAESPLLGQDEEEGVEAPTWVGSGLGPP